MSIFGLARAAALPLDSRISVALTAPWTARPGRRGRRAIRRAHSHGRYCNFGGPSQIRQRARGGRGRAASARRAALGALLAARAEAPRVAMWAQLAASLRPATPRRVGALLVRGVRRSGRLGRCCHVQAARRRGVAAHGTGPAARPPTPRGASARRGRPLCEPLRSRPRRAWAAARRHLGRVCVLRPRAPGFAQELEAMLFRGAPARRTLAVALRYRPASRSADDPLHLQGFGAKLALKSSEYGTHDKGAERGDGDDDADEEAADDDDSAKPSWLLRKRAHEPVSALGGACCGPRPPGDPHDRSLEASARHAARHARTCPRSRLRWRRRRSRRRRPRRCERRPTPALPLSVLGAGAATINGLPLPLHAPDALFASLRVVHAERRRRRRCARSGSRPTPCSGCSRRRRCRRRGSTCVRCRRTPSSGSPTSRRTSRLRSGPPAAAYGTRTLSAPHVSATRFTRHNALTALVADPADAAAAPLISHALLLAKRHAPLRIGLVPHGRSGAAPPDAPRQRHGRPRAPHRLPPPRRRRRRRAAGRLAAANLSKPSRRRRAPRAAKGGRRAAAAATR